MGLAGWLLLHQSHICQIAAPDQDPICPAEEFSLVLRIEWTQVAWLMAEVSPGMNLIACCLRVFSAENNRRFWTGANAVCPHGDGFIKDPASISEMGLHSHR